MPDIDMSDGLKLRGAVTNLRKFKKQVITYLDNNHLYSGTLRSNNKNHSVNYKTHFKTSTANNRQNGHLIISKKISQSSAGQ